MDSLDAIAKENKDGAPKPVPHSWAESDRFVPRVFVRPAQRFMEAEAAGGVAMLITAVIAIVWANSPWQGSYESLWGTHIGISVGEAFHLDESLRLWVNEGLMAIFFFVMALEIKREAVRGEPERSPSRRDAGDRSCRGDGRARGHLPGRSTQVGPAPTAGGSPWRPTSPLPWA